jgi:hypothetical protein
MMNPNFGQEDEAAPAPAGDRPQYNRPAAADERDKYKWTPRRTIAYLFTFGVLTWMTAFLMTYLLVQVLLRVHS